MGLQAGPGSHRETAALPGVSALHVTPAPGAAEPVPVGRLGGAGRGESPAPGRAWPKATWGQFYWHPLAFILPPAVARASGPRKLTHVPSDTAQRFAVPWVGREETRQGQVVPLKSNPAPSPRASGRESLPGPSPRRRPQRTHLLLLTGCSPGVRSRLRSRLVTKDSALPPPRFVSSQLGTPGPCSPCHGPHLRAPRP